MRHSHLSAAFVVLCTKSSHGDASPRIPLYGSCSAARFHAPESSCLGNYGGSFLILGSELRQCVPKLDMPIPHYLKEGRAFPTSWNSGGLAYSLYSAPSKTAEGLIFCN